MEPIDDRLVAPLETLIQTHTDRSEGYQRAQRDTESPELKSLFADYVAQSDAFRAEWTAVLARHGERAPDEASLSSVFQQAWMEFKAGLSGNDRETLLDSCLQLERSVLDAYQRVLDEWPDALGYASWRQVVEQQRVVLQQAHERIRALKTATHPTNT